MDISLFLHGLDSVFPGDPQTTDPTDPRWQRVCDDVSGFTSPSELAVLNLAASLLPVDECYLEVGAFKGRSLCGAVQGNAGKKFYVVENYLEFGIGGAARAAPRTSRRTAPGWTSSSSRATASGCWRTPRRSTARSGSTSTTARTPVSPTTWRSGSSSRCWPTKEVLVLIDDATWPMVADAHRRYLDRHDGCGRSSAPGTPSRTTTRAGRTGCMRSASGDRRAPGHA